MAFIDQVQYLTSLTVSDNDELSQFLKDGVLDVTNRWLSIRPQDIEFFGRESSETTSNASLNLNSARIISVIREDGTNNQWRNCRKISPALQYDVTDVDSLNYASKINPAYMIGDAGKISVFPAPGAAPNAFKAYYVNKDPVNGSGSALIHSHDDILYFPIDKVYLVVIYAGMKLLQANMGATTITDLSVTAVPPDVPSLSASSVSFSQAAPTYTKVSFSSDPGSLSVTAVPPDVPSLTSITFSSIDSAVDATLVPVVVSTTLGGSSTAPAYAAPTTTITGETWLAEYPLLQADLATPLLAIVTNVDLANATIDASPVPPEGATAFSLSSEFDDALLNAKNLIDNNVPASGSDAFDLLSDEDTELVGATLQTASQELQRASTALQGNLQTFSTGLSKFSADVQEYQAEVAEMSARAQGYIQAAQGYASEVSTRLSVTKTKIGEYQARAQDSLQEFNEDNAAFQAGIQEAMAEFQSSNQIAIANAERSQNRQIQNAVNDMKAIFDNNAQLIQKFGSEIQEYQAEVGAQVQEYTQNLQRGMQQYQTDVQQELNEFNKENAAYQVQLQVSLKNADFDNQEDARLVQKYQAEQAQYAAEVNSQIQEYTQNLQADGMGYQWLQDQYAKLKAEYDTAFMIAAPKQQQQQVRA